MKNKMTYSKIFIYKKKIKLKKSIKKIKNQNKIFNIINRNMILIKMY